MELPRGITAFYAPEVVRVPDERTFRGDCWSVAISLGGRVVDRAQVLPGSITSFVAQVLDVPGGPVTALLNRAHPWLGFCTPVEPGDCSFRFLDPAPVAEGFAALGRYLLLNLLGIY